MYALTTPTTLTWRVYQLHEVEMYLAESVDRNKVQVFQNSIRNGCRDSPGLPKIRQTQYL